MKQFFVQFKKDFASYFEGFNAYILIAVYYLLSFFSALYLGDYFLRETDVMNAYFVMQPTVLILIIPAVTMRTWAEEFKSGTIELLLTQPMRFFTLVSAKFSAAYFLFLILVLGSVPFLILSNSFSVLDRGMVLSGYCGLVLCGALFTAAGCFISACCRNIITSFVCTVFTLFFISQFGFSLSETYIPADAFSFDYNYSAFLSGAFFWGNVFYFVIGTALFLWLNVVFLLRYINNSAQNRRLFIGFTSLLFIIFFAGNLSVFLLSDSVIDVTANKAYTLSDKNSDFLKSLDKRIDITLYEAKNKREDGNSRYAAYASYVERFLKQIERASSGAVRHTVVRVEPFSTSERQIINNNIPYKEDDLGNKTYMFLELSDNNGNMLKINAIESLRQNLLETDIMRLIRLFGKEKKSVVLSASSEELEQMQGFYSFLNEFYDITTVNTDVQFIPPTYDAFIIVNPTDISHELLLAMDQYILNGGNVIMFYEPSLLQQGDTSYLFDFLLTFGIKPVKNSIILNDASPLTIANPSDNKKWKDIRSVMVNEAGEVNVRSGALFQSEQILSANTQNIAVRTLGKFDSYYSELQGDTNSLLSRSANDGQFFFVFDSDLLKDYLYVASDSNGSGFYQIVSFADNQLFYLQLLDKATGSHTELDLNYPHYPMNLTSVGNFVLNAQKQRYQSALQNLEHKIASLQNELKAIDTTSVKNIGNKHKLTQELEETEDQLNLTKKRIITDYQSVIAGLSFVILLLIPAILLGILGLALYLFRKYKKHKIRRLVNYEIAH